MPTEPLSEREWGVGEWGGGCRRHFAPTSGPTPEPPCMLCVVMVVCVGLWLSVLVLSPVWAQDLSPLRVIGAKGPRSGQLYRPVGLRLAWDGQHVVVAEPGQGRLSRFQVTDGTFVDHPATGLDSPHDVEECTAGWLVTCGSSGTVELVKEGTGRGGMLTTMGGCVLPARADVCLGSVSCAWCGVVWCGVCGVCGVVWCGGRLIHSVINVATHSHTISPCHHLTPYTITHHHHVPYPHHAISTHTPHHPLRLCSVPHVSLHPAAQDRSRMSSSRHRTPSPSPPPPLATQHWACLFGSWGARAASSCFDGMRSNSGQSCVRLAPPLCLSAVPCGL
jgi:hypothetical protein